MSRSFANFAVDFCYRYWFYPDTAPVSDPSKES